MKKVNLDTLISKYIHRPILKEMPNTPLYARVGNENETTFDAEGMRDPRWQAASKLNYNSPTNVRRLFIGDDGVTIQYHKSPVRREKTGTGCWQRYSYSPEDNIGQLAYKVIGGELLFAGTGLSAISRHWSMSNIEEVYITSSILLSETLGEHINNSKQLFNGMANVQGKILTDDKPQRIFEISNGDNVKNIRNKFPRLKTVAFVSNLDIMLKLPNAQSIKEGLPESLTDIKKVWYKHIWDLGAANCGNIVFSDIPFEHNKPPLEFAVRPGIYRFDSEILQDYAASYKERVIELGRQNRDGSINSSQPEVKTEKSEYEVYLDQTLAEHGISILKAAIQLAFIRSTTEEIEEVFGEMSTEGNRKYRPMVGK